MFHIHRAFRVQGRQVGSADVGMQRRERLAKNGFIERATPRGTKRQSHGAESLLQRRAALDCAPASLICTRSVLDRLLRLP